MASGIAFKALTPSYRHDRAGWNRAWEAELSAVYGDNSDPTYRRRAPSFGLDIKLKTMYDDFASTDEIVRYVAQMRQEIYRLQHDLTKKAIKRYAERDMPGEWCGYSREKRVGLLLEGLVRTCEATSDFEPRRGLCPETSFSRMNSSPLSFLKLLEALLLSQTDFVPENYRVVPCTAVENMINLSGTGSKFESHSGYKIWREKKIAERTYFLSLFVWQTLLAFCGESEQSSLMKIGHGKARVNQSAAAKIGVNPELAAGERPLRACQACQKTADQPGISLQSCRPCNDIGRRVYYCGKMCQKADWKTHKKICGSHDALLSAVISPSSAGPPVPSPWPQPNPGYTRSPALIHQLNLLAKSTDVNYFFIPPAPQPDVGIRIPPGKGREVFRENFLKLICEDDILKQPPLITRLFVMLDALIKKFELQALVPLGKLKDQINKEFQTSVDDCLDLCGVPR